VPEVLSLRCLSAAAARLALVGLVVALGSLWGSIARATAIGPNCGTCQGSTYELTYSGTPIASTADTDTWRITYTIDATNYWGGGTILNAVGLKVSSSLVSATLVDAPGGVGSWFQIPGGINAMGCSGAGGGFECVVTVSLASAPVVPGFVYEWVFDLEIPAGELLTGPDEASVKARYANDLGKLVGDLVSEAITLEMVDGTVQVPEPGAAALLLLGVAGLLRAMLEGRVYPRGPE
jgi:hypothetical protein